MSSAADVRQSYDELPSSPESSILQRPLLAETPAEEPEEFDL